MNRYRTLVVGLRLGAVAVAAGSSVCLAGPSHADKGWRPCVEASPLVPCSTDSQYPCGPTTPIWRCPPDISDAELVQTGSSYLGGQAGEYAQPDLGFVGRIAKNNPTLLTSFGPRGLTNAGRAACAELDAAQGRDDDLNLTIAARFNRVNGFKRGEGALVVGTAMHWYCPKWRPMLYDYHVNPDGSVDGAP